MLFLRTPKAAIHHLTPSCSFRSLFPISVKAMPLPFLPSFASITSQPALMFSTSLSSLELLHSTLPQMFLQCQPLPSLTPNRAPGTCLSSQCAPQSWRTSSRTPAPLIHTPFPSSFGFRRGLRRLAMVQDGPLFSTTVPSGSLCDFTNSAHFSVSNRFLYPLGHRMYFPHCRDTHSFLFCL